MHPFPFEPFVTAATFEELAEGAKASSKLVEAFPVLLRVVQKLEDAEPEHPGPRAESPKRLEDSFYTITQDSSQLVLLKEMSLVPTEAFSPTENDVHEGRARKRQRVERACNRCRQKRAKCDGNQPCSQCAKANVVDACLYPLPTKRASRQMVTELEEKLKRLEEHLHGPPDASTSHEGAMHLLSLAGSSPHPVPDSEEGGVAQFLEAAERSERMLGLSTATQTQSDALPPSPSQLPAILLLQGGDPKQIYELPPYQQAVELVNWFEEHTHAVFPVLQWSDFLARFHGTWPTQAEPIDMSHDRLWLATLNLVLAFSAQIQLVGGATQSRADPTLAARLFGRSQALIATPGLMTMGNVQTVQVLLLVAQYAMSSSQAHLTANTVALAISISRRLRLDRPESYVTLDVREAEWRRRLWSGCIAVSGLSSAMLGTPTPVSDFDIKEALLPTPLPGEDPPDSPAPRILFFRETIKLFAVKAQVLRRVYETTDSPLQSTSLSAVLELDEKLNEWARGRPECFKRPMSEKEPLWLELQRNVLTARYLYIRLLLHRQVLFALCRQNLGTDEDGRLPLGIELARVVSGRAALAASDLLNHVAIFYQRQLAGAWWHNLSHLYASALALLAALAVSRRHPQLDADSSVCPSNARHSLNRAVAILDNIGSSSTASAAQKTAEACSRRLKRLIAALDQPPTRPASPPVPNNIFEPAPSSTIMDDAFLSALLSYDMPDDFGLNSSSFDAPPVGLASWASMDLTLQSPGTSQLMLWS